LRGAVRKLGCAMMSTPRTSSSRCDLCGVLDTLLLSLLPLAHKKWHGQLPHRREIHLLRRGIILLPWTAYNVSGRVNKCAPRQPPTILWQSPDECLVAMIYPDSRCATCSQPQAAWAAAGSRSSKLTSHTHGRNRRDKKARALPMRANSSAGMQSRSSPRHTFRCRWVHRSLGLVDLAPLYHDRAIRCFALVVHLLCFTRTPCRTVSHCRLAHGVESCPLARDFRSSALQPALALESLVWDFVRPAVC
jgi:hypothetical protein